MDLLAIHFFDLFNPEFYINYGGLWLLLFIIFAETGLMFGFFLPGDSLLFIAGIYSQSLVTSLIPQGTGSDFLDLLVLIVLLCICGISGNMLGYWFGMKSGPYLFKRADSFIFKKRYLLQAKSFYDEYGGQTIIFARFLPTVRTFVPIVAGVVKMDWRRFMFYNVSGCLLWVSTMTVLGHYLYRFFLDKFEVNIKDYLEFIVIGLIVVTTLPFVWKYYRLKRKNKRG